MSALPIIILFAGMIFLMLLGLPLAYSLFASSIVVMAVFTGLPLWQMVQKMFSGINSFVLTAIPFSDRTGIVKINIEIL